MLIYLVTVFSAICGSSARKDWEEVCYGSEVMFPKQFLPQLYRQPLYFTPKNGGESKVLMEEGKAKDSRLKVTSASVSLTDVNKRDEGVYTVLYDGKDSREVLKLKVLDCTEMINRQYMHNLEHVISDKVQYLEYNPPDNEDVPLILWNRTNTLNNDKRRGNVFRNNWRIPGVTQADNDFYNFRRGDKSLDSRILLTVKENTRSYNPKVNEHLLITNPFTGGPWTVTFKQETEDEWVTVMKDGRLLHGDDIFSERITIQSYGIEIYPVESTDSGTFEFRDQQGNLALSVQVEVIHESHHLVTYIVAAVALLLGICCCCCCKKRFCKKDKSADAATEGTAVTYHDNSTTTATGPVVYYHGTNQPTGPSYSNHPYPSVYPPHPVNHPAFTEPAAVSIEPPPLQPNTAVYPPQPTSMYPPEPTNVNPPQPTSMYPPEPTNVNPPQPTSMYPPEPTNVNPPQPTSMYPPEPTNVNPSQSTSMYPPQPTNVNPPQPTSMYPPEPTNVNPPQPTSMYPPHPTNVNPPQPTSMYPPEPTNPTNVNLPQPESSQYPPLSEVGPPTSQGSAAAPTFSSDVLSSDAELQFELKGVTFPSAPFLSSDETSSNVYNSDKLNFL
ncbi:uncharacterized protein LOC105939834 isoform X2 [Fundulus heteroclitus]|uniref:uncharacterized protein LOC105939834 isoform X2 n=1 Tax=Fundulus heteroclitus TaxID=8078 RepID=UPI00165AF515|nr:uncharacterized protein LOC105939834 isoform X2 [Fundulus heteroclitus]